MDTKQKYWVYGGVGAAVLLLIWWLTGGGKVVAAPGGGYAINLPGPVNLFPTGAAGAEGKAGATGVAGGIGATGPGIINNYSTAPQAPGSADAVSPACGCPSGSTSSTAAFGSVADLASAIASQLNLPAFTAAPSGMVAAVQDGMDEIVTHSQALFDASVGIWGQPDNPWTRLVG